MPDKIPDNLFLYCNVILDGRSKNV